MLLGALTLAASVSAEKITFVLGTTQKEAEFSNQAMYRWANGMRSRTDGDLDMQILSGETLGDDCDLLQQLMRNTIQVSIAGPVILHHLLPEYQCLEAEFVYKNAAHGWRVWNGPLGEEVNRKLQNRYNIRIVSVSHRGARHLTSKVPIRIPADLQGIKIRITNTLRQRVFRAFGAQPLALSINDVYPALHSGIVDAQENPLGTIYDQRFYEVQRYVILTGHVWSYFILTVNNTFYQRLSPTHRQIFDDEAKKATTWLDDKALVADGEWLAKLKAQGMQSLTPDIAAFRQVAAPVVEKFAREYCRPGLLQDIASYATD
jgi:tripartite ATP-independent transporter DctP family solute receptor